MRSTIISAATLCTVATVTVGRALDDDNAYDVAQAEAELALPGWSIVGPRDLDLAAWGAHYVNFAGIPYSWSSSHAPDVVAGLGATIDISEGPAHTCAVVENNEFVKSSEDGTGHSASR